MSTNTPYRPSRLLLQWHITDRCNLRCAHCYQDNYRENGGGMAAWRPILEQFHSFLASTTPPIQGHITLTGGEPFAHPEFPALLDLIVDTYENISFAILCNGTMIDDALAQRLAGWAPRFVQVSIEGTPETHDALRGKGNHAVVVAGIRRLVAAGVRTMIAFTAHSDNFREFPEVARLGRSLKVARVWADRLIPQGQGGTLRSLTAEETREFIALLRQTRLAAEAEQWVRFGRGTEIALHRALQFLAGGSAYHCTAGDSLITVMPDGTLYPCRRMPISAGNLHEKPLALLYDGELFRELRDTANVASGCAHCVYERLCRGGLRCLAYAEKNTFTAADPGCWLASSATATSSAATTSTATCTYV